MYSFISFIEFQPAGRSAFALIAVVALLFPSAARNAPLNPDVNAVVWVADHKTLLKIDPSTNQVSQQISLAHKAKALAVASGEDAVWVLVKKELVKFDSAGRSILEIDLKDLANKLDEPTLLAINPYDNSLWVGSNRQVLHIDREGRKLQEWASPGKIEAIQLHIDESLWVLTRRQLLHLSPQADILHNLDLKGLVKDPEDLAIDGLGGILWVAGKKDLIRLELNQLDQPPRVITLPDKRGNLKKLVVLAADPVSGTMWLAAKDNLLIYDRVGTLLNTVDLKPHNLGKIEAIVYESVSSSLWLGGKEAVGRFTGLGEIVSRFPVQKETAALAVVPFTLFPTLSLLEPPDKSLTNNPRPTIRFGLGASCIGTPCNLPEGYTNALLLDVDLNGQTVGSQFQRSANEAFFSPVDRLPEGGNVLSAYATDFFGHSSEPINSSFTIDTIPPVFLALSPVNGSVLSSQVVTIEGDLDDPTASVTLFDQSGVVIGIDGANFTFSVTLLPGANTFTLIARDPAGNETQVLLDLTFSSLRVTLTSPVAGADINSDSILVTGEFEGPITTGITVNGVVALIFGNQFFANDVSLDPGENVLIITATTLDGQTHTETITVNNTASSLITVERISAGGENSQIITTIAGTGVGGFSGDGGLAINAQFLRPTAAVVGSDGSVYVVDSLNNRIRRIAHDGIITTIAGTGVGGFSGDGGPATQAQLNRPWGIAIGLDNTLYIADFANSRIRRIAPDGIITTIAGTGSAGFSGDGGSATQAQLQFPRAVALAPDGSLYIADSFNHRIRRVGLDGIITTVTGNGSADYGGDNGPATEASLKTPSALTIGPDGTLYIADTSNYRIRKVEPGGIISTIAGTGFRGFSGDGFLATTSRLTEVLGIAFGNDGRLYFSDTFSYRVRRLESDGTISTVAGSGVQGFSGDGRPAIEATMDAPFGMDIGPDGSIYIADNEGNHRVRKITSVNVTDPLAPFLAAFKINDSTGVGVLKIEVDYDGDGQIDLSTTDPDAVLQYIYSQPGAYVAKFTITDSNNVVHQQQFAVIVNDQVQQDVFFMTLWDEMNTALVEGNINSALIYLKEGAKQKFQPVFEVLLSNMPQIIASYSPLRRVSITDNIASYAVRRNFNGQDRIYFVYFVKDADGVWRLDEM